MTVLCEEEADLETALSLLTGSWLNLLVPEEVVPVALLLESADTVWLPEYVLPPVPE